MRNLGHMSPHQLLSVDQKPIARTKMVNTIGPQSSTTQIIGQLLERGLNTIRLNFSHGTHEDHAQKIYLLNKAIEKHPYLYASVMLDTKGPEIRTGVNFNDQTVVLKKGQYLKITTDYSHLGTSQKISCSYQLLPKSTSIGKKILFADGSISSNVISIDDNIVTVQILNDGKLGSKKNMCLPGAIIQLPTITEKDKQDILDFGLKHKVNFIAVSFTRYREDLDNLRKLICEKDPHYGPKVQLISKIQNHEGIQNIDEIIQASDGIMIARGDMGMEIPIEKVVILQKYIMEKSINKGKFVITATQMIESMESKPRPTRAEVSDITNAVFDQSDAVMTSGQTANGQFPLQSAECMNKICRQTQFVCNFKAIFEQRSKIFDETFCDVIGAIKLSFQLNCNFIFVANNQLSLLRRLSALRPKAFICCFTDDINLKNSTSLNFGVYCFNSGINNQDFLKKYYQMFKIQKAKILRIKYSNQVGKIIGFEIQECQL